MIKLVPMGQDAFAAFVKASTASYAEENVLAGRWPATGALERSRNEFQKLLPDGLATPDNFVFEIQLDGSQVAVGALWLAVMTNGGSRTGHIYQLQIHEAYRRRGFATAALMAAEDFCSARGITSLGLHVFEFNQGAKALYDTLGYSVTSYNMSKSVPARRS